MNSIVPTTRPIRVPTSDKVISVSEAKQLLIDHLPVPKVMKVPVGMATGMASADNIYSPISLPPFPQSSMDGYAVRFKDLETHTELALNLEIAAGDEKSYSVFPGTAIRIFTGAAIPEGADTVVMQEDAIIHSKGVSFDPKPEYAGLHVRQIGSHLRSGDLVLSKGQIISPATAGHLSGLGITEIGVFQKPSVAIITTGNEVIEPGSRLTFGKIYNSNQTLLCAALREYGVTPVYVNHTLDHADRIYEEIQSALTICNLLLIVGGVSVGSYDYVPALLEKAGVRKIFHRIKQKPGKPFYFGKLNEKMIFGLPGNPASALVCFREYVSMALQSKKPICLKLPLKNEYRKKSGLAHFLKGFVDGDTVEILEGQESYKLQTFSDANCLVYLAEEVEIISKGELVDVRII